MTNTPLTEPYSTLRQLRSLAPIRPVSFAEALRLAELQANRFLAAMNITEQPVPIDILTELPRLQIRYQPDQPTAGLSFWNRDHWLIQLSADQPHTRQRFTAFHEYKHIIDHPMQHLLYQGDRRNTAHVQRELAADYFAGCLLIPRRALKAAWCSGIQRIPQLADLFDVSRQAIEVRLMQTGLRETPPRCGSPDPARGSWRLSDALSAGRPARRVI